MFKYFNTNKNMRKNKATILVIKIRIKLLKCEWKILTGQNLGYDSVHIIFNLNKTVNARITTILNKLLEPYIKWSKDYIIACLNISKPTRVNVYICLCKLDKGWKKDEDFMPRLMMSQQILGRIYS